MSMKTYAIGALALLLFAFGAGAQQTPAAEPAALPSCGDCHDQAKTFAANPHGRGKAVKGVTKPGGQHAT